MTDSLGITDFDWFLIVAGFLGFIFLYVIASGDDPPVKPSEYEL